MFKQLTHRGDVTNLTDVSTADVLDDNFKVLLSTKFTSFTIPELF